MDKLRANKEAVEEDQRLQERCVISSYESMGFCFFILNIRSLSKHFDDLFNDMFAIKAKHICLVETWIDPKVTNTSAFEVPGKNFDHASIGKGRSCAIFSEISIDPSSQSDISDSMAHAKFQIMVLSDGPVQLVLMYLSKNCPMGEVTNCLEEILSRNFLSIVTGDFNFDAREENSVINFLSMKGFKQLITEPTHDKGRVIDNCYVPITIKDEVQLKIHSPYYTDHDAILHEYEIKFKNILAQQNTCLKSTHFFICFLPLYFKSLRNMKDVKMMIMMMKCTFKCGFRMKFINVSFKLPVQ